MPPKRRDGGKRKLRTYIAPKPKKPRIWARIVDGLAMLRYRPEIREIRQTALARRIKNPSACIVAPVYAAVEKFRDWSTATLENVFEIGNELHRITLQQLKLRANSCYPLQCVCPTFLVNLNKVSILVRPTSISHPLHGGVTSSVENDQVKAMDTLMTENHGVLLQCSGRTFAFWKDRGKYFALIPEGFASPENYMPVLLKSTNLRTTLEHSLQLEHGICTLFAMKVLSKVKVPMTLRNVNEEFDLPEIRESDLVLESPAPPPEPVIETTPPPPEAAKPGKKEKKKVDEPEPADMTLSEDVILQYTADFKDIDENRGILRGKEFCDDPDRILHTIVSAAIFLHHVPANLWTSTIITDIMAFGKKIFYLSEAEDLLDNEDWMDRIKFPIKFARKNFSATFEKIVFGKVTSTDTEVLTVEQGLRSFFDGNDTGLLVGPQLVLVWQQKSNYFMFDPKERDAVGRKFTRMFSAEIGSTDLNGCACVTWFRSIKKLAEVYSENVALKHRKDPYRIVRMKVYEANTGLVSEGGWFAIAPNKWLMVGTKTICDYSYADDKLRVGKAICMGISALVAAMEKPEDGWDAGIIDGILADGIELFKQSLTGFPPEKTTFTHQNVKKLFDIGEKRVRLYITDCAIRGPMLGEPKGLTVPLKTGLVNFFDAASFGLFTVREVALALWRGTDNHYYLFYPYEKLLGLPPQCLCVNDSNLPPMGLANTMRFKTIPDMFNFMSTSLNAKEMDEYCMNPIDIFLSEAGGRPPLYEYDPFREGGAIMRPFKDLHEGHEMYGVRADKQTLANLLVALGFNRINPAGKWNKEDMVDILNIGDKIFCKIYMGLPECQARDYKLQWEDVTPVIGMNKFTYTREPMIGVIEILPEPISEEMEGEGEGGEYDNEEGVEQQDDELFVRPEGSYIEEPAATNDMKGILQTWEKKKKDHHEAILETDFFTIAIWRREDLYFIFDPKAAGENGELTERRIEVGKDRAAGETFSIAGEEEEKKKEDRPLYLEKRSYNMFDNEGAAYTAWFSTFDEFYDHIFNITPPDYRHGKMTLHDLTINNTPVATVDFGIMAKPGFRTVNGQHSILRGSMTQGNPSLTNRNKQEFTNSIVAMAFARITPSSKMTTTLLDVVLKYGDRLYSKSMNALKKADINKFCSLEKVSLDEIPPVFSIYKIRFNWKVQSMSKGNFYANELKKGVGRLGTIEAGSGIILVHKGFSMGLWKGDGNAFYLYDPFETNPTGVLTENGLPSLSRFAKLDSLLTYIINKFICVPGPNTFQMYQINIKSTPVEDLRLEGVSAEEDPERVKLLAGIPKTQETFQPYQTDMKILRSALGVEKTSDHSMAIAAVVHSRLQFIDLWNYNVGHRITCLSKYLNQKTECELGLSSHSYDDIRCSFAVDNEVLCHIVFAKTIQGPICSSKRTEIVGVSLKNAITLFFKSCQHILITLPGDGTAFALWKENGKYYLFGIDHVHSELYVVCAPTYPPLYDIIMRDANPDDNVHNWYELRSIGVNTVPIKEAICRPLHIVMKSQEGPMSTEPGAYIAADSKQAHYFDHIAEKPESAMVKNQPYRFIPVGKGVEILHSRGVMRTHRFFGTKDFFPSLQAACVEASALSQVKSPSLWTKRTLEKLLTAGVNLYVNTVAVKNTACIQMVDFKGNLFVGNYELEVCPLTPTVQAASKEDLQMCLTWVLRKYQTAYLYTQSYCFTLILENNDCFLYYPGSSESLCEGVQSDCSCLIKFCTISDLLDRVLTNAQIAQCQNVCIGPICVFRH